MRLVYVLHEPLPSEPTSTEQVVKAAAAMARLGEEVVVTTPRVALSGGASRRDAGKEVEVPAEIAAFYGLEELHGERRPRLVALPAPWIVGPALGKPWHDARAVLYARKTLADVVYVRDPIPLALALRSGRPVVFETYRFDLNTRWAWAPWRAACYGHPRLLGVVTHSGLARESFLARGFAPERVLVAHNGYDPPPGRVPDRDASRRDLNMPADAPVVVYAGGVSPEKGLDALFSMAPALPDVHFLVVGHVPGSRGAGWFRAEVEGAGLDNVRMIPRVGPGEVLRYLAAADVLYIPTTAAPLRKSGRTVLPMKTFQYLGAGRPIVGPDLPDLREVLESGRNALLVPPDDPKEAVAAIRRILSDADLARRLGQEATRTAQEHSWSARARRIRDFIRARLADIREGA
ncbi:MAG: glycosyltransferase [Gemmatimonadota bacterium]